jgi:RimJ/RimL family protein N-acetyltransferase
VPLVIRETATADAGALLDLQHRLDDETEMMMLEPGERTATVDDVRARLRETIEAENSTIIVAADDDRLVGYAEAEGGRYRRTRHTAYVVIGVLAASSGKGVGSGLLDALDQWAAAHGVRRLELTVRVDNERARSLYERAGYEAEGTRYGSLLVRDQLIDELAMARIVPQPRR